MPKQPTLRVSIKPYLHGFINEIASEYGIDDPTEVVNVLLLERKTKGCGCQHQPTATAPQPPSELDEFAELLG